MIQYRYNIIIYLCLIWQIKAETLEFLDLENENTKKF